MNRWHIYCAAVLVCVCTALAAEDLAPGLIGEYFPSTDLVTDFPMLGADQKPALKRVDAKIEFAPIEADFYGAKMKANFYVRWSGAVRVPKDGLYTFFTESDDGTMLFIDDKLVVDNRGLHGMQEEEGDAQLSAGDHRLRLDFIQGTGAAGCVMRWLPVGGAKQVIPDSVLFHDAAEEAADVITRAAKQNLLERAEQPEPPDEATLADKIKSVLPTEEEDRWLSVGWRRNLQAARMESQLLGRPLFLWIMNGNPLGCT